MLYSELDYKTLKNTIYMEARGECLEGQIAVAHVILNRVKANKPYFGGKNITDVCRKQYQFECWNDIPHNQTDIDIREPEAYNKIEGFLRRVLDGTISDNTHGCDHYNNPRKESASWVNNVDYIMAIGEHRFYRSRQ